ncbi:hypothetical protein [Pedobacter sp.]|uniref:hypothetical protein n=1 Tax=Pedobacter sp. TaxID=1411316 RepID=UPI002C26C0B3|nr:hypothetical protein [Pedobacter sp.]HWW40783.1 hypothetical protein [Pedobacter sp.]
MNKMIKCHENKMRRLMLMLTLVLGILTFFGNARSVIDPKPTQTEVEISNFGKAGNRTISYQHALDLLRGDQARCFRLSWNEALLSFNNLIQVKLALVNVRQGFQPPILYYYLTRILPQSSDEEEPFSA